MAKETQNFCSDPSKRHCIRSRSFGFLGEGVRGREREEEKGEGNLGGCVSDGNGNYIREVMETIR